MKPICVPCQRFFRPKKNGVGFIEGMPTDNAQPGVSEAAKWKPYKLWMGDLWECPNCGAQTIIGTGREPIAEHYQPQFQKRVDDYAAVLQVNDC